MKCSISTVIVMKCNTNDGIKDIRVSYVNLENDAMSSLLFGELRYRMFNLAVVVPSTISFRQDKS